MGKIRRSHRSAFKAKVAFEAMKKEKTIAQLSSEYGVHPNLINQWKRRVMQELPEIFSKKRSKQKQDTEELVSELYRQIGQLKVEVDWLKKNLSSLIADKRWLIEPENSQISIARQGELLCISRSAYYYQGRGESADNEHLMRLIDEEYTKHPFYGSRKLTAWLKRQGYTVNRKRVARLMRLMEIEAIYPKPQLSNPLKEHQKYPYLLQGLAINRPDYVWAADITYVRLRSGFVYLVAIIDWYSRYVLSSEVSITREKEFGINSLERALQRSKPEIFNTDQGCNSPIMNSPVNWSKTESPSVWMAVAEPWIISL